MTLIQIQHDTDESTVIGVYSRPLIALILFELAHADLTCVLTKLIFSSGKWKGYKLNYSLVSLVKYSKNAKINKDFLLAHLVGKFM